MLFFLRIAWVAMLCGLAGAWAADTSPPPAVAQSDVHVERVGDSFTVHLVLHTPVEPARAWAVLTDFEHMADFVPHLSSSQVTARSDNLLTVHQKGVVRHGLISTAFESVREIHLLPPHEIRAHGIGGNIQRMDSLMQLEPEGSGTRLTYHAEVQPGFWFPPLIGPALVRQDTAAQFSAMLQEMLRR